MDAQTQSAAGAGAKLVKLVTAPARNLASRRSLAEPNPYTTDWTDMADLTLRALRRDRPLPASRWSR